MQLQCQSEAAAAITAGIMLHWQIFDADRLTRLIALERGFHHCPQQFVDV